MCEGDKFWGELHRGEIRVGGKRRTHGKTFPGLSRAVETAPRVAWPAPHATIGGTGKGVEGGRGRGGGGRRGRTQ